MRLRSGHVLRCQRLLRHVVCGAAVCALGVIVSGGPVAAQQPPAPSRAALIDAFNAARIARAQGRYVDAIPVLRDILRRVPDDTGVREELGYALLLDGQYAAAQHHFQILAERSPDPQKRALYRAVLRRIVSERPVGLRLVFALQPSSNLNGGADGATFETDVATIRIDEASQAQEGWRWSVGLAGYFQHALSGRDVLRLDWAALETRSDRDQIEAARDLGAQVTWERSFAQASAYVSVGVGQRRARSEQRTRAHFGFGSAHRVGARGQLSWNFRQTDTEYTTLDAFGILQENQDRSGPLRLVTLRYAWLLARTQSVWVGLQFEDSDPGAASQRYDGRILQIGGVKRFDSGLSLDGVLSFGARDFEGAFALQARARRDDFTEFSLSAQHDQVSWRGFSPRATCTLRANRSNVGLFDATTHECGFELTRGF